MAAARFTRSADHGRRGAGKGAAVNCLPGETTAIRAVLDRVAGMTLAQEAAALAGDMTGLRHALHQEPEIGLQLPLTQRKVLAALDGLPLEITLGQQLSSITAVLRGGRPGPTVLLRGDMDALPVHEAT